jgi:hypothetical protein
MDEGGRMKDKMKAEYPHPASPIGRGEKGSATNEDLNPGTPCFFCQTLLAVDFNPATPMFFQRG